MLIFQRSRVALLLDVVSFKSMYSTLQTPAVEIEQRTHETLKKTTIRTTWRITKQEIQTE